MDGCRDGSVSQHSQHTRHASMRAAPLSCQNIPGPCTRQQAEAAALLPYTMNADCIAFYAIFIAVRL